MAEPLVDMTASSLDSNRPDAFVTLLTSTSYLPGTLTLLHALNELHPSPRDFKIVCLVTPETVDARTIGSLRNAGYDLVIGVEPIASGPSGRSGLQLMDRPDLDLALTKLHIFRLGDMFSTIIFMDADTLPIRPLSHLFKSTAPHILSACPDIGWPDCFNSGVMVVRPRLSDFENLRSLMDGDEGGGNGSFDGADQGLLNQYFSEEGAGGPWNRLPFTYNVTPSSAYQYKPAFQQFSHKISVIHFIGPRKPWGRLSSRPAGLGVSLDPASSMAYEKLIDRWFDVYDRNVRPTAVHEPNLAKRFTVPENVAVWNQPGDSSGPSHPTDGVSSHAAMATGTYVSLPLEGRLDLMMPQPERQELLSTQESQQGQPQHGPSQPPPESSAMVSQHAEEHHHRDASSRSSQQEDYAAPAWDASRQPPPKDSRPEMALSVSNVYAPAWDEPAGTQTSYFHEHLDDFALPSLPTNVLKNDWYGQFTSTVPDPTKVSSVFPWEAARAPRAEPSRKFPQERQQLAETLAVATAPKSMEPSAIPAATDHVDPHVGKPLKATASFGVSMADYTNAWDMDTSIGRYAKRLTDLGIARMASGMYTVPPSPGRASSRQTPSRPHGNAGGFDTSRGSRSSDYTRASYHDKCTQTDRPSQNDAIVQATPETSPTSESPPKLRLPPARPVMVDAMTMPQPSSQLSSTRKRPTASRGRVWDPQTDIEVMRHGRH